MPRHSFARPEQETFKAVEFNGLLFLIGRGLFVHIMKYYPSVFHEMLRSSRSKEALLVTNFTRALRGQKSHFKGLNFRYVDVHKKYKQEMKLLSDFGEGWWPERSTPKVPGVDYTLSFANFALNYENPPHYVRMLGKGVNVDLKKRYELQSGVEFTKKGYSMMFDAYKKVVGPNLLIPRAYPTANFAKKIMRMNTVSVLSTSSIINDVDWPVWKIRREEDIIARLKVINHPFTDIYIKEYEKNELRKVSK